MNLGEDHKLRASVTAYINSLLADFFGAEETPLDDKICVHCDRIRELIELINEKYTININVKPSDTISDLISTVINALGKAKQVEEPDITASLEDERTDEQHFRR